MPRTTTCKKCGHVEKTCIVCGDSKPPQAFPRDRNRRDGRDPRCAACMAELQRARAALKPKARRRLERDERKAIKKRLVARAVLRNEAKKGPENP